MNPVGRRKRILPWLLSALGALLLAEIACRVNAFFPLAHYDRVGARAHLALRAEAGVDQVLAAFAPVDPENEGSSVRPFPHPYVGWFSTRALRALEEQGRWFASPESEMSFDIVILGGSVAADFANRMGRELETRLAQDPKLRGQSVRVWNDAHAGFKAPQTGNLLAWLYALDHRPDAIVLIDGFNEVAISATNARSAANPVMPSFEFWGALARGRAVDEHSLDLLVAVHSAQRSERNVARTALKWGFANSALLTRITLARLATRRRTFEAALAEYQVYTRPKPDEVAVRGPAFDAAPGAVSARAVNAWRENARQIAAVSRMNGTIRVQLIQPTTYDAGAKPLTPEEERDAGIPSGWRDGVHGGYASLRAAAAELSAAGTPIFDATRLFAETNERAFVDVCHLNELGTALLCDVVVAELSRALP